MKQRGKWRKDESRRSQSPRLVLLMDVSESSLTEGRLSANRSLWGGGGESIKGRWEGEVAGNDGKLYCEN